MKYMHVYNFTILFFTQLKYFPPVSFASQAALIGVLCLLVLLLGAYVLFPDLHAPPPPPSACDQVSALSSPHPHPMTRRLPPPRAPPDSQPPAPQPVPVVCAHGGYTAGGALPNTRPAYRAALAAGYKCIEARRPPSAPPRSRSGAPQRARPHPPHLLTPPNARGQIDVSQTRDAALVVLHSRTLLLISGGDWAAVGDAKLQHVRTRGLKITK